MNFNDHPRFDGNVDDRDNEDALEPGQLKPKNEGINNTDVPGVPIYKRAKNNPTGQDEGLSSGGEDPLADL
jgi:hypothetical protein